MLAAVGTKGTYGLCQRARPSSVLSCPSTPQRRAVRPEFFAGWILGSCRPCYTRATGGKGVAVSRRRASESGDAGKSRGASQGAQQPKHRDSDGDSGRGRVAMATGARRAAAIACAERSTGGVRRECCEGEDCGRALEDEGTRTEPGVRLAGRDQQELSLPGDRNNERAQQCGADCVAATASSAFASAYSASRFAIIVCEQNRLLCCSRERQRSLCTSRPDEEGARNLLQRTSSFGRLAPDSPAPRSPILRCPLLSPKAPHHQGPS